MKIQYDKTANALYVYFRKGKILRTKKLSDDLLVDVGAKDKIIGFEVLNAAAIIGLRKSKNAQITIPVAITA